ncbi:MAG: hypothetical protein ACYC7E_15870 [Armatimonadota bacterium]
MPAAFARTAPVAKILEELRFLRSRDLFIEEQARLCGKTATKWWVGCGASFALLFFLLIVTSAAAWLGAVAFVLIPIGILCLIFGIIWSTKCSGWKKQDMEDRRLMLAQRFLEVIGQDVPGRAQCSVGISFDHYKTHGKLVEKEGGGWLNPITRYKYQDTWFSARGRLYDGNRFRATIEQTIHRKEKAKRKYTKVNERVIEEVTLVLRVSQEGYPNWAQLAQALQPGVVEGVQITGVQVTNGSVRIKGKTPASIQRTGRAGTQSEGADNLASGDTLLKLFLYVYSQLQNCRAAQPASA